VPGVEFHIGAGQLPPLAPHLAQFRIQRIDIPVGVGKHEVALTRPLLSVLLPGGYKGAPRWTNSNEFGEGLEPLGRI